MTTGALPGRPEPPRRPDRWRSSWVEGVLFAVGAGLFALLVRRIGAASIATALVRLGPALPLIIGVETLAVLANTLSWRCAIAPEWRGDVPYSRLLVARIVGDAVSYVVPAGAGEIPKVRLLARHVPMRVALASVALAKLTEGIALGLFGVAGLVVAWPILMATAVSGVTLAVAALLTVGLVAGGLVAARLDLLAVAGRLCHRVLPGARDHARPGRAAASMDSGTARFRQGLVGSTCWHVVGWLVNVVELVLACHFLGLHPSLGVVFAGEALGALFDLVFFFVPMRIGAAEGGRVFVFGLFGLDAATGLTLGLVRRIRELAWTAGGLTLYAWLARAPSRGALSETRA